MKPRIRVFITKSMKFRAIIDEYNDAPSFEVTIGEKEWNKGKGRQYTGEII